MAKPIKHNRGRKAASTCTRFCNAIPGSPLAKETDEARKRAHDRRVHEYINAQERRRFERNLHAGRPTKEFFVSPSVEGLIAAAEPKKPKQTTRRRATTKSSNGKRTTVTRAKDGAEPPKQRRSRSTSSKSAAA